MSPKSFCCSVPWFRFILSTALTINGNIAYQVLEKLISQMGFNVSSTTIFHILSPQSETSGRAVSDTELSRYRDDTLKKQESSLRVTIRGSTLICLKLSAMTCRALKIRSQSGTAGFLVPQRGVSKSCILSRSVVFLSFVSGLMSSVVVTDGTWESFPSHGLINAPHTLQKLFFEHPISSQITTSYEFLRKTKNSKNLFLFSSPVLTVTGSWNSLAVCTSN